MALMIINTRSGNNSKGTVLYASVIDFLQGEHKGNYKLI